MSVEANVATERQKVDRETLILSQRLEHIRDRTKTLIAGGLDEAVAKTKAILEADEQWPMSLHMTNQGADHRRKSKNDKPRPKYPAIGGITWIADRGKWNVVCVADYQRTFVGQFAPDDFVAAVAALNLKQIEIRGPIKGAEKQHDLEVIRAKVEEADRNAREKASGVPAVASVEVGTVDGTGGETEGL